MFHDIGCSLNSLFMKFGSLADLMPIPRSLLMSRDSDNGGHDTVKNGMRAKLASLANPSLHSFRSRSWHQWQGRCPDLYLLLEVWSAMGENAAALP